CHVGRRHRQAYSKDGCKTSHPEVMMVRRTLAHIALIQIIRPYSIECRDIASHSRHERCQQRCKSEAQQSRGEVVYKHHRRSEVVIGHGPPVAIKLDLSGSSIFLGRDYSLSHWLSAVGDPGL